MASRASYVMSGVNFVLMNMIGSYSSASFLTTGHRPWVYIVCLNFFIDLVQFYLLLDFWRRDWLLSSLYLSVLHVSSNDIPNFM
jgi:hypothetical protein